MTDEHTRHLGVRIDRPAAAVYAFAGNPTNLPSWAPGLSSAVTLEDGRWIADSPMGRVAFAFAPPNDFGVLDHEVTLPSGEVVLNPMRAIPNGTECDVVFTLRRRPGVSAEEFERDAAAVSRDLQNLKRVLEQ
ncbi:SRPBCC family protein [uncultured Jatrophihabitans sp.]|uniref:SRPBCC family protein n=1 Tax=uncultured Jatrophihabitans sp. TaxID=1610747 RepID=UPI0035CB1D2C